MLSKMVKKIGHNVIFKNTIQEGLSEVRSVYFDIVFLDVKLPDGDGLDVLPEILEVSALPEVIIMTGSGCKNSAKLAIKYGAWDYIEKPSSIEVMKLSFIRALQYRREKSKQRVVSLLEKGGIVGDSPEINRCLKLAANAAKSDVNVLITGETGTGKELFARAIHKNSSRSKNELVVVDCATLTDNLIESTLFGHDKGAFTGAERQRQGLIKEADHGTLFLDEVGELPLLQQKAFLRVLQEHKFRPIGSKMDESSDFRLITATNRDLEEMVRIGTFRKDLFFRIQALGINIPPLRERHGDIRDITSSYLSKMSCRYGMGIKGYSPEFFEAITTYSWPGNVRELVYSIENALSESLGEPTLFPIHLPGYIRLQLVKEAGIGQLENSSLHREEKDKSDVFPNLKDLIYVTEKKYFQDLMTCFKGNMVEISRTSGLSRSNIYTRLKKYNISKKLK